MSLRTIHPVRDLSCRAVLVYTAHYVPDAAIVAFMRRSRYNLYITSHSRAQPLQNSVQSETEIDTASLSNCELAKHHLRLFAAAGTPDEFASRADSAFSRSANITVNGVHLSRELYAQQWGVSYCAEGSIHFSGVIETPQVRIPMLQNPVLVGIMYEASFPSSVDGLGAVNRSALQLPVSVTSTINLIIAEDKILPASCTDRRRIVSVNQAIVDKDGFLTFPLRRQ
ncbi:hypothetical protein ACEPAF_8781 [Sanghuangporus sanghuang]